MRPTDDVDDKGSEKPKKRKKRRRQSSTNPYVLPTTTEAPEESDTGARRTPFGAGERTPSPPPRDAFGLAPGMSKSVSGDTLRPASVDLSRFTLPLPPHPKADARSGHIWPPSGRRLIEEVPWSDAKRIDEQPVPDPEGDRQAFHAGKWRLEAQPARVGADLAAARLELARRARVHVTLGAHAPSDVALCLTEDDEGPWIWTVAPWAPSLARSLAAAHGSGDGALLGDLLCAFADVCVFAMRFLAEQELRVSFRPRNFAFEARGGARWCDVGFGQALEEASVVVFEPCRTFGNATAAIERYGKALADRLSPLPPGQLTALGIHDLVDATDEDDEAVLAVRRQLASAIRRQA